jgi:hypothetical protein
MATTASTAIAVIGIDIGKNWFHIVGLDDRAFAKLTETVERGFSAVSDGGERTNRARRQHRRQRTTPPTQPAAGA